MGACAGGLLRACFGGRLHKIALPLGPMHKLGLDFPRLSAQLAQAFCTVFSAVQNCHLKKECIRVQNREIGFEGGIWGR